jgi:diguanylate cyclase (GGDEF)-like protein
MDWNTLPDLLALTALVAVFFSLLPRNAGRNVRLWLVAWVLILIHFVAKFFDHSGVNAPIEMIAIGSLDLSGLTFMWAATKKPSRVDWLVFASLAIPQLAYIAVSLFAQAPAAVYVVLTLVGFLAPTIALVLTVRKRTERDIGIVASAVLAVSLLVVIRVDSDPTDGINNILTWIFFTAGVMHWRRFGRPTAGAITTAAGFIVWSSVFPISVALANWAPHLQIDATAYNVPKYVVAIGIILMLLEDQMERSIFLAAHDDLTGLPNRRLLEQRLREAIERADRSGAKVALLTIDLDGFKTINDSFGHSAGDALLRDVACRFAGRMRKVDTCARFGGDEFVIVADNLGCRLDAESIARDLLTTLEEPIELAGSRIRVGASIGVALYPDDGSNAEKLYAASDAQMYLAKHKLRRSSDNRATG